MTSEETRRAAEKIQQLRYKRMQQARMEKQNDEHDQESEIPQTVTRPNRPDNAATVMNPQQQQLLIQQRQFHAQRRRNSKLTTVADPSHPHSTTTRTQNLHHQTNPNLRRRAEDVEYWRQRAGWFNDDESMKAYNNGIYDSYYGLDDEMAQSGGNGRGGRGGGKEDIVKNTLKILSIIVALGLSLLMFRAIMRRMNTDRKDKKHGRDHHGRHSDSKSRSSSVKRSRSRSRSRRGEYDLMRDGHSSSHRHHHHGDDESKSRRSTRSKSSSKRRSRSRSRSGRSSGRSRSKPRAEKPTEPVKAAVLV